MLITIRNIIKPFKELPNSNLLLVINNSFGNLDNMYNKIKDYAKELKSSGYLFLVENNKKELFLLNTANQDSPYLYGFTSLLCIDLCEHAYYLEYKHDRNRYLEEILKIINFSYANKIFAEKK